MDQVRSRDAAIVVAIFMVLGAWLRLNDLSGPSLWSDEGATWLQVKDGFVDVIVRTALDTYPPLFNLFAFASIKLFGATEFALRLPAALFGVATIPAMCWLGRLVGGRTAGMIAAVFCALSPFEVFFAQEARAYSLLALTSALYAAAILSWLADPNRRLGALTVAAGFALLYSHPYGTFVWLSVGGAGVLCVQTQRTGRPVSLRRYLKLQAITFALFLPWALILLNVARLVNAYGFWIARPTVKSVASSLVSLADGYLGLAVLALGWLLLVIARIRSLSATLRSGDPRPAWPLVLIAAAVLPIVIGIALSLVSRPIFVTRYAICVLPAWYALAAAGYASRAARPWLRGAVIAVCALATVVEFRLSPRYPWGEDWRSLAAQLRTEIQRDDCILLPKGRAIYALDFYFPRLSKYCVIYGPDLQAGRKKLPSDVGQIFLFGDASKTRRLIKALPAGPWQAHEVERFGKLRVTRLTQ